MRAYTLGLRFFKYNIIDTCFIVLFFLPLSSCLAELVFSFRSSNWNLLTDAEAGKQEISNQQRENNNSVYTAEKSPDKRATNGGVEVSNASVVNSPDLSPVKNARNRETEEMEVRKTKVSLSFI